jgi:hypothetical protein
MDQSANPQPPPTPNVTTASIAAAVYGDAGADGADPAPLSTAKRVRILFDDDPADDPNKRRSTVTNEQAPTPAHRTTEPDAEATTPAATSSPIVQTPAPTNRRPTASSSARSITTASSTSSFVSNRADCINNSFFKWARQRQIESSIVDALDAAYFKKERTHFMKQVIHRFREEKQTAKVILQSMDSQPRTRSEARETPQVESNQIVSTDTTDTRRLSRLHFEDMLQLTEGTSLKMYVLKSAAEDSEQWWGNTFQDAIRSQPSGFGTMQINAKPYYCFHVTVLNASHHRDILAGNVSEERLKEELFRQREGFSINILGDVNHKLPLQWSTIIEFSVSIMFFGPPTSRSRNYSDLFSKLKHLNSIRGTFLWMMREVAGDTLSSYAVMNAYLLAENSALLKLEDDKDNIPPLTNVESIGDSETSIMNRINEDCRVVFQKESSGWIDQHAPLISEDHFNEWIAGVKKGFPRLWSELASLRDINPNKKRQSSLIAGKERQVLHQIMTNFRQRNPKLLVWWSMVELVALMAWSVGTTAFDCLTYWGAHVSTKTRDRMLSSLFNAEQDKTVRK